VRFCQKLALAASLGLMFFSAAAKSCADMSTADSQTLGTMLCGIKQKSFLGIFKLIFAISYVSGFGLLIAAIFKLKQVKDNPTQIPVSTPMVLFLCAGLLMYLPNLIVPAGETIFGDSGKTTNMDDLGEDGANIGTPTISNLMQTGN